MKKNVIAGFFWKAMESGGDQLITFLISIVLARLLGPEKYGTMAIMLIFVAIANVIIQNGFQTALIQKKEITNEDLSSVFWLGLLISAALYACFFVSAPLIADFFRDPEITAMLRVLSLLLFAGAAVSVEIAIVARSMNFRVQCIATILADIISGLIGVIAAFRGMGTWALILQQLIKHFCLMLFLYRSLHWLPAFGIHMDRIGTLFRYGWKVLVSGLIDTFYSNIYTPFISRLYDTSMVGLYNRGNQFPQVIANSMAQMLQAVMLPAFSRSQDEKEQARKMLRRTIKMFGFLMFPAMFGIMAVADSMVLVLLGADWLPAVPLLRLCCLSFSVWHIHVANLQVINANGRSDIYLKLEIIKKIIGILVLVGSIPLGITGMIFLKAVFDYVCTLINAAPNKKIMQYGPLQQWKDILPEFLLSAAMGIVVYGLQVLLLPAIFGAGVSMQNAQTSAALVLLIIQIGAGAVFYMLAAMLLKLESFRYLIETAKLILLRKSE